MDTNLYRDLTSGIWAIHPATAASMLPMMQQILEGNTNPNFSSNNESSFVSTDIGHQIGVIPVQTIIRKKNYCGDPGLLQIEQKMLEYDANEQIGAIIFDIDSPGGEGSYLSAFTSQLRKLKTPTISMVSGMAASAAYGIAANTDHIFVISSTDMVGSIGTLVSLRTKNPEYKSNPEKEEKLIWQNIYASKSFEKNKEWEEAVKGNFNLLRDQLLDPFNEEFHNMVRTGRPEISTECFNGRTYLPEQAESLGLINGMKSKKEVIEFAQSLIEKNKSMALFNTKTKKMKTTFFETVSSVIGREIKNQDDFQSMNAEEFTLVNEKLNASSEEPPASQESLNREEIVSLVQETMNSKLAGYVTTESLSASVTSEVTKQLNGDAAAPAEPGATNADETNVDAWEDPENALNKQIDADLDRI